MDNSAAKQNKNYITPEGAKALENELENLWKVERPPVVKTIAWAAANGDRSENGDYIYGKRRLRQIDSRIKYLSNRLAVIEVFDSTGRSTENIFFGAWVTILKEDESEKTFRIVGIDEIKPNEGFISWRSPLARAVLGKKEGDVVYLKTPKGDEEIEIIKIKN